MLEPDTQYVVGKVFSINCPTNDDINIGNLETFYMNTFSKQDCDTTYTTCRIDGK